MSGLFDTAYTTFTNFTQSNLSPFPITHCDPQCFSNFTTTNVTDVFSETFNCLCNKSVETVLTPNQVAIGGICVSLLTLAAITCVFNRCCKARA